jgi:hypothetical protein
VHVLACFVSVIAHENDPLQRNFGLLGSLPGSLEKGLLSDESSGLGVDQLASKLFYRVGRVCWASDATRPMKTICHDWRVNAVWGEEAQHVALLPVEHVFEALAKCDRTALDIGEGVRAICVAVDDED